MAHKIVSRGVTAGPISRGNLRQQVTSRILWAVFGGGFHPGQHLIVQRLSELYEVSPTPVREALVELSMMGIVELLPNKGAIVLPFGPKQVREIGQIRRVLEVEATRSACGRIDESQLESLQEAMRKLKDDPTSDQRDQNSRLLDTQLHSMIARDCGSPRLTAEIERYLTLFGTLRDVSHHRDAATNYSRSNDIPEHLEILAQLRAVDPDKAAAAMDCHIRSSTRAVEDVLFSSTPQNAEASSA